ncbi:MAG: hypothetical protein Q4C55_05210 [Eubacterium sp.]|nr:hypothetical protein [Eubacterium sp.]
MINRILIIDDDRALCTLLQKSVQSENIAANCRYSGREGLEALEQKNSRYIRLEVSDPAQAARILEGRFHTQSFKVISDRQIALYDVTLPTAQINRALIESGIDLFESHLFEATLEDYFKKVTGGEGIA